MADKAHIQRDGCCSLTLLIVILVVYCVISVCIDGTIFAHAYLITCDFWTCCGLKWNILVTVKSLGALGNTS